MSVTSIHGKEYAIGGYLFYVSFPLHRLAVSRV